MITWTDERIKTEVVYAFKQPDQIQWAERAMMRMRNAWRESDDERLAQILAKNEIIHEMREEFTAHIAEINAALDNALMEATALDTLNQECQRENQRLRQAVNEQHAELRQRRQEVLTRFM